MFGKYGVQCACIPIDMGHGHDMETFHWKVYVAVVIGMADTHI